MAKKIRRLSDIAEKMDSVKVQKTKGDGSEILSQAQKCWDDLWQFRRNRERCIRYTYGNQWGDTITNEHGKSVTEEQYIIAQGSIPLKNNLIRRLVRTVNGVYRNQNSEPTCTAIDREEQTLGETMSIALQANWRKNKLNKVYGRQLDEFLISGVAITKETIEWRNGIKDCFTYTPNQNYVFFTGGMSDVRLWDLNLIGEIHDMAFNDLCEKFADSPKEFAHLKDLYGDLRADKYAMRVGNTLTPEKVKQQVDFLYPRDMTKCRVIEVWTKERKPRLRVHDYLNATYDIAEVSEKEAIEAENEKRIKEGAEYEIPADDIPLIEYEWFVDSYWYYRFITPTGEILAEGESPYKHREHPYTLEIYPMIDGEAHSFVEDVIDQQRYVNRLITLNDWVIRSSAKGLTLFPEECVPDTMSIEEVMDEVARPNGFILYKPSKTGDKPTQIANKLNNVGISEMLSLQLSLMEDITGVTGALQGKQTYAGMSGTLYAQQQQTAANSLLDILETFGAFIRDGALKKVYNIQSSYDTKRMMAIAGRAQVITYDPEIMEDVQFDLTITESKQTPVYRSIMNEYLFKLMEMGQIGVKQLLEVGSFEFADRLLENLKAQEEQMQAGQAPQGIDPQLLEQIQAGANPEAVQALKNQLMTQEQIPVMQ